MIKFVVWLVLTALSCCGGGSIPISEYDTLESFYYATGGESWAYHNDSDVRWDFTYPNTSSPCTWDGIDCICTGSACNVNKITLNYFGLEGYIPDMQNLTYLSEIYMHGNHLRGTLDGISKLPLTVLSLYGNEIEGTLDPLRNISSLSNISLAYNKIEGDLTALSDMTSLEGLYLESNLLNCTLHGVSNLHNLTSLVLTNNKYLHGTLTELRNLTNLMYIELSNNWISSDLSPISGLHSLRRVELSYNGIYGSIEYLANLTNLSVLDLGLNYVSGSVLYLSELTNLEVLLIQNNYDVYGALGQLSSLSKLQFLILFGTYINGQMDDLMAFPLLKYIDLYKLLIFGSLSAINNTVSLVYCDFSFTYINGNLKDISDLKDLKYLFLSDDLIEGNIDAVNGMRNLIILDLSYTLITGALTNYLPAPTIEILVLQDNLLTGHVPASLFDLPNLRILNLAQNCLHAHSLSGICNSTALTNLIMDGLHSKSSCRKTLSFKLVDTIYEAETVVSDVPGCLYSLPHLKSVRLANNGITGSLPMDAALGENFTELVLTNNFMHSAVPHAFQNHNWETLDLSYNSFTGTLLDSLRVSDTVKLEVNRLSGSIPSSLYDTDDVSILKGNLFACTPAVFAQLHDDVGDAYICGSDAFNFISYIWIVVIGALAILLLLATRNIVDGKDYWIEKCYSTLIKFLKRKVSHIKRMVNIREVISSSNTTVSSENISKFIVMAQNIRWVCGITAAVYICVFMPLYSAFSSYFGSYYHQYAWTVSAAFISSKDVGITLFVMYVLALFVLFYYIRYAAADALVHNPKLPSSPKYYVVFGVIFAINLAFVVTLNGNYVYVLLNYNFAVVSIVEASTSFIKVVWNSYVLVSIVRYAEKNILKSESHDLKELAIMFIINNVVMPCYATSLVEPNCFYNMIYAPYITITTFNYYADVYFKSTSLVVHDTLNVYNHIPLRLSWSYSYQCTSVILTSFATIFLYSCLFCTILPPIVHYTKNKTIDHVRQFPDSYLSKMLNMFTFLVTSYTGHVINVTRINEALVQRFILQLVGSFTILFSFGVMIPLLGLVVFISIIGQTMYTEYCVGRYINVIVKTKNLNQQEKDTLIAQVDSEFKDIDLILLRSSWQILLFVGIFYGCFVLDMVGSEVGYHSALWAPISLFVISIILYASPVYFKSYIFVSKQIARGYGSSRSQFRKSESAKFELTDSFTHSFAAADSLGSSNDNKILRISESDRSSRIVAIANPMNSNFDGSGDSIALPTHRSSVDTNRESAVPTIIP